jgi:hypothetical protein
MGMLHAGSWIGAMLDWEAMATSSCLRIHHITHDWCYAYWLAIDCMHDRLIGMEVPWRVCVSVGVCIEWTLLVLSVDGVLLP